MLASADQAKPEATSPLAFILSIIANQNDTVEHRNPQTIHIVKAA
jgi:hypothetical protein